MEMEKENVTNRQEVHQLIQEALAKYSDPKPQMTQEEREQYHQKILAKIESGKRLTSKELAYLRENDPVSYQKALRMEQKRQWLLRQMEQCKSRQEVQETFENAMCGISEKDPDREAIMATYQETYREFQSTARYRSLPDTKREAEAWEARGKQPMAAGLPGSSETTDSVGITPIVELYDTLPCFDRIG